MDANKLQKLRQISYKIKKCCGTCEYGQFGLIHAENVWGQCKLHNYDHLKHADSRRQLSINQFGYCSKFKWNEWIYNGSLHRWEEFLET
jgi:hypothetical protein